MSLLNAAVSHVSLSDAAVSHAALWAGSEPEDADDPEAGNPKAGIF
jgi:hypothetical protein